MRSSLIRRLLVLAIPLTVVASDAVSAEISGTVTDYADGKPIDGVRVSLMDGKIVKSGPIVTMNGDYRFKSVAIGTYTLRFDLTGYTPRPDDHSLPIQNPADTKRLDVELMVEGAGVAYYHMAGARFARLVRQDGSKPADYQARWGQLRRIGPTPSAKVEVVRGLADADGSARQYLPIDQYLVLDPKELVQIAESFNKALRFNERIPEKGFANVGDEVIADVVLHELRKSSAEPTMKAQFVESFDRGWKGSKAAGIVTSSYKRDRLQLSNPR
jgi:hypothetical protein